ncbi:hypothetical protein AAXB25_19040 [Paenibacillus lautus]|uniref:hypothetical protein n=1 Tax=Paenibacillus lautus TaxID=1401 RepID=UPI003D2CFB7E
MLNAIQNVKINRQAPVLANILLTEYAAKLTDQQTQLEAIIEKDKALNVTVKWESESQTVVVYEEEAK